MRGSARASNTARPRPNASASAAAAGAAPDAKKTEADLRRAPAVSFDSHAGRKVGASIDFDPDDRALIVIRKNTVICKTP
jgi:hypothetical protein